jgi:AraC-like DNA-binding protein
MLTSQVKREVKNLLAAGYEHYSREHERLLLESFLLSGDFPDLAEFSPDQFFLTQQPLRSAKNMSICLVAIMCRYAADNGANDRRCYALSDTYINIIEDQDDVSAVYALITNILTDYRALIQEGREKTYSRPVQRAIRLIDARLYEPCSLAIIAQEIKLHPAYLSRLFKKEVGENITGFIRTRKMEEAKNLIANTDHSVSEIAEMLGYSSLSYFSKVFRQTTQTSPRAFSHAIPNK